MRRGVGRGRGSLGWSRRAAIEQAGSGRLTPEGCDRIGAPHAVYKIIGWQKADGGFTAHARDGFGKSCCSSLSAPGCRPSNSTSFFRRDLGRVNRIQRKEQMGRIAAKPIAALLTYQQPLRNGAEGELPVDTSGSRVSPSDEPLRAHFRRLRSPGRLCRTILVANQNGV
jgi:hypothetical protein